MTWSQNSSSITETHWEERNASGTVRKGNITQIRRRPGIPYSLARDVLDNDISVTKQSTTMKLRRRRKRHAICKTYWMSSTWIRTKTKTYAASLVDECFDERVRVYRDMSENSDFRPIIEWTVRNWVLQAENTILYSKILSRKLPLREKTCRVPLEEASRIFPNCGFFPLLQNPLTPIPRRIISCEGRGGLAEKQSSCLVPFDRHHDRPPPPPPFPCPLFGCLAKMAFDFQMRPPKVQV